MLLCGAIQARTKPAQHRLVFPCPFLLFSFSVSQPFSPLERRALGVLAGVYALRMAGLFLILPVFALYAQDLAGQTPLLIGLALGAYGLTQAILQIPFGMASDRLGRKPVIVLGLLIFAGGSVFAALAHSIWGVIAGRALQGAGAIAGPVMAYLADLTRDENRAKSMAVIGVTIGASFVLSLILGSPLNGLIGVPGIFWLTAAGAIAAIFLVAIGLPKPVGAQAEAAQRGDLGHVLRDGQMMRLNAGVFVLHLALTAIFVALPHEIVVHEHLPASSHWKIYLPTMLTGFVLMIPLLRGARRPGGSRRALLAGMAALVVAEGVLAFGREATLGLGIALTVFFAGFSLLEAMQPSMVSRLAPGRARGAASGVYATAQFLGAFAGGALGGALLSVTDATGVFLAVGAVLFVYLLATFSMPEPRLFATREVRVGPQSPRAAELLAARLAAIPGVTEAIVMGEVGIAYLKVDDRMFDPTRLEPFAAERP